MDRIQSPVRLSFRLLDVMADIARERANVRNMPSAIAAQEDWHWLAQRDHRLHVLFVYLQIRLQREWERRPFCMNCGSDEPDHNCEPDLSQW